MNLSSREKHLVLIAAAAIASVLTYQFVLHPTIERTRTLRRTIPEKQDELMQVRRLAREHERISEEIERLSNELPEPEAGFSPLSSLEKALQESGIQAPTLRPSPEVREERFVEVSIDIRIDETGWKELVDFFRLIESAGPSLRLSRFDISRRRERNGGLRADITATALRRPD